MKIDPSLPAVVADTGMRRRGVRLPDAETAEQAGQGSPRGEHSVPRLAPSEHHSPSARIDVPVHLDGKCLRDTHENHHGVEYLSAKDGETVRTDSQ